MSENTKIEWADHTANLWWGCDPVHAGCDNCYARTFARSKGKAAGWTGARYATVGIWRDLPKWNIAAGAAGRIDSVFCGSMMDIFEKSLPALNWNGGPLDRVETGHLRDRFFYEVVPATPNLLYLLLTKRPSNILKMVPPEWLSNWPANVMTGTSPVNQPTADTLIPQLLRVPGRHFLSLEPLLGPVDLKAIDVSGDEEILPLGATWLGREECGPRLDWVIVGGESGPGARPIHPDWARGLRDQCAAAGVPFLFKQYGEWKPISQMAEAEHSGLYKSNVIAKPHQDQGNLDDIYGRRCTVPTTVLHADGTVHDITEPMAFLQGTDAMQIFRVGKKAAGRLLDGIEHNGFPEAA